MSEVTTRARRRAKDTTDQVDAVKDEAPNVTNGGEPRDEESGDDRSRGGPTITSELKETFREAMIEVLRPVMRKATTSAAKYAVTQGPNLVKDKVAPRIADAGGAAGIAKGVASKGGGVAGAVGGVASELGSKLGGKSKEGKSPSGTGRGRRLPVEEFIDVGVDLETAYNQFTQFEDWPKFMHRVERLEQRDDATLMWHENIWGVRRSWEVEITTQIPCERLVWRSKNGPQTIGVATFHRLSDNLTRVMITMDFQPQGLFEKTSSGTRISRRALVSDLMRFKGFIELRDEATGAWDGRIEDGEVVDDQDAEEDEPPEGREEDEEPQAAEDEDEDEEFVDEDEEDDEEPQAGEDEDDDEEPQAADDEDYDEEEDEDEERPRGRGGNGRVPREDEDEDEEAEDEEPEEAPKRRRRRPAAASSTRSRD